MNLRSSLLCTLRVVACVSSTLVAAGCGDASGTAPSEAEETAQSTQALSSTYGACSMDASGHRTTSLDTCAGSGSTRVLVSYRTGTTCSAALGIPMGAVSSSGLRKSFVFATAPTAIRERFCAFEAVAPRTDAEVEQLVGSFCGDSSVIVSARDCSRGTTGGTPSGSAPDPQGGPVETDTRSPNGCDVCGTVAAQSLYVTLPPTFVADRSDMTMVVRFARPDLPDLTIVPPQGEQTFVVHGLGASVDGDVTVFPPGVSPEAKGR